MIDQIYDTARDRGDKYLLILRQHQEGASPLTICVSGSWSKMLSTKDDFVKGHKNMFGVPGKWKQFSIVAQFPLDTEQKDEHMKYLEGLDFKWQN